MIPACVLPLQAVVKKPRSFAWTAFADSLGLGGSNNSTQTWSNVPIGAAQADRLVVVFIAGSGTSGAAFALTGVTIGGITATVVAAPATRSVSGLAYAVVPTGTTATIVATLGGGCACNADVAVVYGLDSPVAISSQAIGNAGNVTSVTTTAFAAPADSITLGQFMSAATATHTLSGATSTKDSDGTVPANVDTATWHYVPTSDVASTTETDNFGGGSVWNSINRVTFK